MSEKKYLRPHTTPVYRDSGFMLDDAARTARAFMDELDHERDPGYYIYSRYRNPTVVAAEERIMKIEDCRWALLTQSGMSAIDTALSIFQSPDQKAPWLFFSEIYGGTNTYIDQVLVRRRGIHVERLLPENNRYEPGYVIHALDRHKPSLLYLEVVSNPMLTVTDIAAVIQMCRERKVRVIVDNTFATPFLCRPLSEGADLVIHSATKYLSGHGDLTAGVLCGNDRELMKLSVEYRKYVGHMLSPDDASRLGAQLETFSLRMERHQQNAMKLAGFLSNHPKIEKTIYPGLHAHPDHALANRLFGGKGYGGMITFDLAGADPGEKERRRDSLIGILTESIPLIPSLGDVRSTLLPVEPVWGDKYPMKGLVRLSVGIESYEELEKLFGEALEQI